MTNTKGDFNGDHVEYEIEEDIYEKWAGEKFNRMKKRSEETEDSANILIAEKQKKLESLERRLQNLEHDEYRSLNRE